MIEAKADGRQPPTPRAGDEEQSGRIVNLMATPRKARSACGEDSGDAEVHEMPKKKTATKTTKKATA